MKRFIMSQLCWFAVLIALLPQKTGLILFFGGLGAANLLFLALFATALVQQQERPSRKNSVQLYVWLTLKLSCLAIILYSLLQVQESEFSSVMAALSGIVLVPLALGVWISIEDRKRYV